MKYTTIYFFLTLCNWAIAQVTPICNGPAHGSGWVCLGPMTPPVPGPGARLSDTGTGAQIRVQFPDPAEPNPSVLYAATPTGGLFRTRNVTDSIPLWENITDSTRLPVLGVQGFAIAPSDPDLIYVGTGIRYPLDLRRSYGIGMLKSTDGGRSWRETALAFVPPGNIDQVCHEILIHPDNPDTLHVLCGRHYYRSTDGSATFQLMKTNIHRCPAGWGTAFRDIAFKPGDPSTLYLTTDASYFYVSKNGGEDWEEYNVADFGVTAAVARMDIAISQQNPQIMYLGCVAKSEIVLLSLDGGATWQVIFDKAIRTSYEKHAFVLSPNDDNVLYIGGVFASQLTVTGKTANERRIASFEIHVDHRDIAAASDGRGGDILYSANDGGLYRGTNDGRRWSWSDVSGYGFNNMQFYGIGVAEDFSVVPGGTQDLGTMLFYPDGTATKPALGGDATTCAVDRYDPGHIYCVSWGGAPPTIHRSSDNGTNWLRWNDGLASNGDTYHHPLIAHENGYLYAGTRTVDRLPHNGNRWEPVGALDLPTSDPWRVTAMAVAPSDANVIYAYGDQLYRTDNANEPTDQVKWVPLGGNMGVATDTRANGGIIMAVEVDAANPRRVWASFKTFGSPYKVYFSGDGGETWSNVSRGLPPFPVNALAFQGGTQRTLYAGTDVGVFYNPRADDPESEWLCFNTGLPVCLVTDLKMNYCEEKIVAGTFGRGIWASPLAEPSNFPALEVKRNDVMNFRIFRSDVVVKRGKTLTLQGEIRMAPGKKIIVEKNAVLILDGARIKELCSSSWAGIIKREGSSGFLGLFFKTGPGRVELRNGAVVEGGENG